MTTKDMGDVGLFRLVRVEDESGVSGTGHIADGVVWHDGTCTIHWRTQRTSTSVYANVSDVIAIHGHNGKTRLVTETHPYDRGFSEAEQDAMENCPFASIGGLDARAAPTVPAYIPDAGRAAWLSGYLDAARSMYGADWQTCAFGWRAALDLPGRSDAEEAAKVEEILTMDEAMLDEMLRAEGRDPATVVGQQRELLRAAVARARGQ